MQQNKRGNLYKADPKKDKPESDLSKTLALYGAVEVLIFLLLLITSASSKLKTD